MKSRNRLLWLFAVMILVFANYLIYDKEQLLANGRPVYLELAPVDPRSLMQGDYMRLRYAVSTRSYSLDRGYIVLWIDANNVGQFSRIVTDVNTPLDNNEILLKYHKAGSRIVIGAESFFFEEGQGRTFNNARYGEIRIGDKGDIVLFGLRDENLNLLGETLR